MCSTSTAELSEMSRGCILPSCRGPSLKVERIVGLMLKYSSHSAENWVASEVCISIGRPETTRFSDRCVMVLNSEWTAESTAVRVVSLIVLVGLGGSRLLTGLEVWSEQFRFTTGTQGLFRAPGRPEVLGSERWDDSWCEFCG